MTVKEAIIKALEIKKKAINYNEIYDLIISNNFYQWDSNVKTPRNTISAQCLSFINKKDSRVRRIKGPKGYQYYLTKFENEVDLETIIVIASNQQITKRNESDYHERDLHKLLSTYLKSKDTISKTIYHEKSLNNKDSNQKWIHPDMLGIKFFNLKNKLSNALLNTVNKADAFELISYELKREIKTDYELKKCYFQAVSNSSWANFGYLVAFEISKNLYDEMERLNQSFGIGIIELKANPFESEIVFQSRHKELDFKTIDKLCEVNKEFELFIKHSEKVLSANDKYITASKNEFEKFCDNYFSTDSEVKKYCEDKYIPYTDDLY